MLWADPIVSNGRQPSKRGVSMGFGPDISAKFLNSNNLCTYFVKLEMLIRSHEVKQDGYEQHHDGRVVTIFSAPNYCDFSANKGAWIRFKGSDMKPKYTKFDAVVNIYLVLASSKHWSYGLRKSIQRNVLKPYNLSNDFDIIVYHY